jgi:ABC-type sugar transport system ATPase subunit
VRLDIRDLGIRFHTGVEAVRGLDLTVASGEFVAIVGPSGCGKSTVLNAIASLLTPDDASVGGTILADGVDVCSLSARELNFGYVFQRDNLLGGRSRPTSRSGWRFAAYPRTNAAPGSTSYWRSAD